MSFLSIGYSNKTIRAERIIIVIQVIDQAATA
jgi:hypothetical protein